MSRLDSVIRRLQAQRACLDHAASLICELPGPVLELGLGNGRTYDHLRELFPGREIFAFDRQLAAHPDCVPDSEHLILGDFRETLPAVAGRLSRPVALAHVDCGSGRPDIDDALASVLAGLLQPLLAVGAVVVSDQELAGAWLTAIALPEEVAGERYFLYRVTSQSLAGSRPASESIVPRRRETQVL